MGCFCGSKKRGAQLQQAKPPFYISIFADCKDQDDRSESFRGTAMALQKSSNGKRKLLPSLSGYGEHAGHSSIFPRSFFGRRTRSVADIDLQQTSCSCSSFERESFPACPMPLPSPPRPAGKAGGYRLPRPHDASPPSWSAELSAQSTSSSFNSTSGSSNRALAKNYTLSYKFPSCSPQPLPPPPREPVAGLRAFAYEELRTACGNFSQDGSIEDAGSSYTYAGVVQSGSDQLNVTVVRLGMPWKQSYEEWMGELAALAQLHSPHHLCKIIGYHAEDGGSMKRFVVYERLAKGSLDGTLYGRMDSSPLDWPSRTKVAMGAAQGLAYLHDRDSEHIVYTEFRTSHIELDTDFSAKLTGYGFAASKDRKESDSTVSSGVDAYRAPETSAGRQGSAKSNVWSFGVVLLELLTGRKNMDERAPKEERNLLRWSRPFLNEEEGRRLFLMMDPKLQGRFPARGAKMIAELAHRCLQRDPVHRPAMKEALEVMKMVHGMRFSCQALPWQELAVGLSSTAIANQQAHLGHAAPREGSEPNSSSSRALAMANQHLQYLAAGNGGLQQRSSSSASAIASSQHSYHLAAVRERSHSSASGRHVVSKDDLIKTPPLRPLTIPPRSSCSSCPLSMGLEGLAIRRPHGYGSSSRAMGRLQSF